MCGRATLAIEVSMTSINVASITEKAISQGFTVACSSAIARVLGCGRAPRSRGGPSKAGLFLVEHTGMLYHSLYQYHSERAGADSESQIEQQKLSAGDHRVRIAQSE